MTQNHPIEHKNNSQKHLNVYNKNSPATYEQLSLPYKVILNIGPFVSFAGALVLFVSQSTVFATVLSVLGVSLLLSKRLVSKSLALTNQQNPIQPSFFEHVKKQTGTCKYFVTHESEGLELSELGDRLNVLHDRTIDVIKQKFSPTELTYERYMGSTESACVSLGDHLIFLKDTLQTLESLSNGQKDNKALSTWTENLDVAKQSLADLDKLYHSLNAIQSGHESRRDLEGTMEQIKSLADRAKFYSKK